MVDEGPLHGVVRPGVDDARVRALAVLALGHGGQLEGRVRADVLDVLCWRGREGRQSVREASGKRFSRRNSACRFEGARGGGGGGRQVGGEVRGKDSKFGVGSVFIFFLSLFFLWGSLCVL